MRLGIGTIRMDKKRGRLVEITGEQLPFNGNNNYRYPVMDVIDGIQYDIRMSDFSCEIWTEMEVIAWAASVQ